MIKIVERKSNAVIQKRQLYTDIKLLRSFPFQLVISQCSDFQSCRIAHISYTLQIGITLQHLQVIIACQTICYMQLSIIDKAERTHKMLIAKIPCSSETWKCCPSTTQHAIRVFGMFAKARRRIGRHNSPDIISIIIGIIDLPHQRHASPVRVFTIQAAESQRVVQVDNLIVT